MFKSRPSRAVILLSTTLAWAAATMGVAAPPATAAPAKSGQFAVASQDCASGGRIQVRLLNNTSSATTFTVTWPGQGKWTANVAANDSGHVFFTKPEGTAYNLTTTTPQGLNTTATGTLNCSKAKQALVSMDCTRNTDGSAPANHRLQMTLVNRTNASATFKVVWPGRSGSPWSVTVSAQSTDGSLHWTVPNGTPYAFTTTSNDWSHSDSGKATCGLASGTPGMNVKPIFGTKMPIAGVNQKNADGKYSKVTRTVASVRIPALAVSNSGAIIAVADARVDSSADIGGGTNNVQLAMSRSTDGGATFSAPKIIAHAPTTSEGSGDPSLLVDRVTGKLFCFYTYSPKPGVGFFDSKAGDTSATSTTNTHIRYITSSDDGATWSTPIDLNPSVRNPAWMGMFASSGHGIQLSNGRLVQPLVYKDATGDHASNLYSDDQGATWRVGSSAAVGVNESKAIQRGSGHVVQNIRTNAGGNRWYATASGSGNVAAPFGTAYNTGLLDPACNGDEISYLRPSDRDAQGRPKLTDVAIMSNNADTQRNDLTVRVSRDDGTTWSHEAVVKSGQAGYSTMAVLPDGTVANLYEVGNAGGIFLSTFNLDWVEKA